MNSAFRFDPLPGEAQTRGGDRRNWVATILARGGAQAVQFGALMITARLLTPADFGKVAMILGAVGVIGIFRDLGLTAATVHTPAISHEQVNTLFWINSAAGMAITLIGMALAPVIAAIYHDDSLMPLCIALSLGFAINSLCAQHGALLQRRLEFVILARLQLIAAAASGSLSALMALAGFGVWALVWPMLLSGLLTTLLHWHYCAWRPDKPAYDRSATHLVRFGKNLILFGLLDFIAHNLHNVMLGRYAGPAQVGYYNRAFNLLQMITGYVQEPASRVTSPLLSRLMHDTVAFKRQYLGVVRLITYLISLIAMLMWLCAPELVRLLFGVQWQASVEVVQTLALGALPQAICATTGWIYLSHNDTARMMRWGAMGWGWMLACLAVGLFFGIRGVAWAYTIGVTTLLYPCLVYAFRGTPFRAKDVLGMLPTPVLAAAAGMSLAFGRGFLEQPSVLLSLLLLSTLATAMWLVVALTTSSGRRTLREIPNLLRKKPLGQA